MSDFSTCGERLGSSSKKTVAAVIQLKQSSAYKAKKQDRPSIELSNDDLVFKLFYRWNQILSRAR